MIDHATKPFTGPMPHTPEWKAARRTCIGASQAAAACGVSPWAQPLDVYLECRGELQREETDAMRLGLALEPIVLDEYERRFGTILLRPMPLMRSSAHEFIGATPDAWRADRHCPVDAKTCMHWRAGEFGEEGTDDIPADYVMQAQQQIYVTEAETADVAVLIDGRTLRPYRITRHDALIARMIEIETELWERIQTGRPPEPDWNHRATLELMKRLHSRSTGEAVALDEETAEAWDRYCQLGKAIKENEKEREGFQARVLHAIGDAAAGVLPSGRVVGKTVVAESRWTKQDAEDAQAKIGLVKRRGYVTLRERKGG